MAYLRSIFDKTKKWLLKRPALTRAYTENRGHTLGRYTLEDLPPFTLWQADIMLMDPHVVFGLMVRNGALSEAEVEWSGDERQVRFVSEQWKRIWHDYGGSLLKAKRYGWMPFEVTYEEIKSGEFRGMLGVKSLNDFHPRDSRLMTRGGEKAGVKFSRLKDSGPQILPFPASLWVPYDPQGGNLYGRSINNNSYVPFEEKWRSQGAKDVLRLRMMKDGYSGDIFWVPDEIVEIPDPVTGEKREYHALDIFRQAQEARLAGSSMTMIKLFDSNGNETTGYEPPHDNGVPQGILEWNDRLDWDIWKGQGVFREVFEAASSGSGFSGRSIPMMMFLGGVMEEFKWILSATIHDVLHPLAHINFGREPSFEGRAKPLTEIFADDMAGTQLGGGAMGGTAGQRMPQMMGMPQGMPQQFSDFSEEDHPRDADGRFIEDDEAANPPMAERIHYDPNKAVAKIGNSWWAETVKGDYFQTPFKTRKEAVQKAIEHLSHVEEFYDEDQIEEIAAKRAPKQRKTQGKNRRKMSSVIDAVNKKNEPEGGWTDADAVPDEYKNYSAQFAEEADGAEDALRPFLTPAAKWIHKTIQEILAELRGMAADDLSRPDLMQDILAMIGRLRERVRRGLSEGMLASGLHGFHEVAMDAAEFIPPIDSGGTAIMEPPTPPPTFLVAAGGDDGEPEIRFPTIDRMLEDMRTSPVFSDTDYRTVARRAQEGAFAVTGELEDRTVDDVRRVLAENLERGPDPERFVDDVRRVLTESDGLSEAHLNTVFRTNMSSSLSQSMNDALRKPLVGDYFPYRSYYATSDRAVRETHFALETLGLSGTNIYNAEDPVWRMFEPPWEYNCRCSWTPTSIRQAARRGVQEAKDWMARAKAMADERGGEAWQYYQETKPDFEFVRMPSFRPPPEFERMPSAQFAESDGKWITIGGKPEGKKQHAGGFPVKIGKDGTILAGGPRDLRGKHVSQVKDHFDQQRERKNNPRQPEPEPEKRPKFKGYSVRDHELLKSAVGDVSEADYKALRPYIAQAHNMAIEEYQNVHGAIKSTIDDKYMAALRQKAQLILRPRAKGKDPGDAADVKGFDLILDRVKRNAPSALSAIAGGDDEESALLHWLAYDSSKKPPRRGDERVQEILASHPDVQAYLEYGGEGVSDYEEPEQVDLEEEALQFAEEADAEEPQLSEEEIDRILEEMVKEYSKQ